VNFSRTDANIFTPDGTSPEEALARTTHLCVLAHQDDIEINAYPAVAECYGRADRFFTGVVMTNGAGSCPRRISCRGCVQVATRRSSERTFACTSRWRSVDCAAVTSLDVVEMETLKGFPYLPAMVRHQRSWWASHATGQGPLRG
jgi:hypothetical protein